MCEIEHLVMAMGDWKSVCVTLSDPQAATGHFRELLHHTHKHLAGPTSLNTLKVMD